MRTKLFLALGIVIALLLVLGTLFRSHIPGGAVATSEDCNQEGKASGNHPCLALGVVTNSVWNDGTIALAIPLENHSASSARQTEISALSLSSGKLAKPASLPQKLGDIGPASRAIANARFSGLANPGAYELLISGNYREDGSSRPFSLRKRINIVRSRDGTATSVHATLRRVTPEKSLPPVKINQEHENPVGPPIPDGPSISPLPVRPKATSVAPASSSNQVTIIRDTSSDHAYLPAPPDPTTAASGDLVLSTGNTYLRVSVDDGANFTEIDPTTIFPNADGGLCCDQVMLFDPTTNLFFWLLQYNSLLNPTDPTKPGPNRLRIAWKSPQDIKANIKAPWAFVDLQAQILLKTADEALDYPDLAITNNNLYVSVDRVYTRDPATGGTHVHGLIVGRILLADFIAGSSTLGIRWIGPDQSDDQGIATGGRLTQSSADTMYWAAHVDSSKVKVFRWKDSDNDMQTHDVDVDTWCKEPADYANLAPDGIQWIDNTRANLSAVSSGARLPFSDPGQNHGEVWLAWNAGQADSSGDCSKGRPQPFIKILRINDQSLEGIGEYHIWNPKTAFAYPALATRAAGEIGVSATSCGDGFFPESIFGFLGDSELLAIEDSDVTLNTATGTRIGDYYVVRNSGPTNINLSTQGYAVRLVDPTMSKSCMAPPGCIYHVHYVEWGRPPVTVP